MMHQIVLEHFRTKFPTYSLKIESWYPNGKNTIRVRLIDKREFIFSYYNDNEWSLETTDHYLKSAKNEYKLKK